MLCTNVNKYDKFIFRPHLSHIYLISNLFFHPVKEIWGILAILCPKEHFCWFNTLEYRVKSGVNLTSRATFIWRWNIFPVGLPKNFIALIWGRHLALSICRNVMPQSRIPRSDFWVRMLSIFCLSKISKLGKIIKNLKNIQFVVE